jgi:hypothetical protein
MSHPVDEAVPVKRGRGRPRKNLSPVEAAEKVRAKQEYHRQYNAKRLEAVRQVADITVRPVLTDVVDELARVKQELESVRAKLARAAAAEEELARFKETLASLITPPILA